MSESVAVQSENAEPDAAATEPRAKKRRRQPVEVRGRILSAAVAEFSTKGFDGVSAGDIAERAHVSLSLLLYHFESKDNLWKAVIHHVFGADSVTITVRESAPKATASEQLRMTIAALVQRFAETPALQRLVMLEGQQLTERLIWLCETYTKKRYKDLCGLIIEGQEEGKVRKTDPSRLRFAIITLAATPFSIAAEYQYLTLHNPFSEEEVKQSIEFINRIVFFDD